MLNENNWFLDWILIERILDDLDMILKIENFFLKQQMVVVQKKFELIVSLLFVGEKVQFVVVIVCLESILFVDIFVFVVCFMVVEWMFKVEFFFVLGVLNVVRELILQMKKDKVDGRLSGVVIEKFLDEVKFIKN